MKTGEGKTLTATLAVFLNTLAGDAVHLVTVNDYLARRDAEWMRPIYDALGVTVGVIQSEMTTRPSVARSTPATSPTGPTPSSASTTCATTWRARSRSASSASHAFAIVDEVDNILIDEARTPLIISGRPEQAADTYYTFARLAKQMVGEETKPKLKSLGESRDTSEADYDYEYDEKHKTVAPTEAGVAKAEEFLGVDNLYLSEHGTLVNHLIQSLKAESLYKRDTDYAVIDGEVMIIDEFTGRILEGRRWSEGLHQAVEAKEGVADPRGEPDAGDDHAPELLPPLRQARRDDRHGAHRGDRVHEDLRASRWSRSRPTGRWSAPTTTTRSTRPRTASGRRWSAEIGERHEAGPADPRRDDLGRDLRDALRASCKRRGIEHERAQREARVRRSARARRSPRPGRLGAVTIATNMAGRGVDIKLGGDPEQLAVRELRKLGVTPDDESCERGAGRPDRGASTRVRGRRRARFASSAASTSAAPSATSHAGSTTSSAAAPAARATPASRASSSRPRTT